MTFAELLNAFYRLRFRSPSEQCSAFEQLLKTALGLFQTIVATDDRWQDMLRSKTVPFDYHVDKELTRCYRMWVFNAKDCLRQLELLEANACCPESATRFRNCLKEAEEALLVRTQDEAAAAAALEDVE